MSGNIRREPTYMTALSVLELIFHHAVRTIRKSHGNAIIGLLLNIAQSLILIGIFMLMFTFLGMRGSIIRGDLLLFLMTGIFLFLCFVKAVTSVVGADGPNSAMMKHQPMNTIVAICGAALGELYIQVLTVFLVLFLYHAIWTPLEIYKPLATLSMLLSVWASGVSIGIVLYAIKPWAPGAVKLFTTFFTRMNMIASGKFFLANMLPSAYLPYFLWNPLFHAIDQARGFAFINYTPQHTWAYYPLLFALGLLVIGMMAEFYSRKRVSLSTTAKS